MTSYFPLHYRDACGGACASLRPSSWIGSIASTKATPQVVQVGLDCVPDSGGTHTLMHEIRRALDAPIVSFTSAALLDRNRVAEGVLHVPVAGNTVREAYLWPRADHPALAVATRLAMAADLLLIHGLFRYHAQWAYRLARSRGIPYWVVPHGSLDRWVFSYRALRKRVWMRLVGEPLLRHADLLLLASPREDETASPLVRRGIVRVVVPWPVQPHGDEPATRARVRATLRIPADARVLLSVGRLHRDKRVLELIRAVGAITDNRLHLILVGPDTPTLTASECSRRAAQDAPGRVHVIGPAYGSARSGYLDAADAFVSLSPRESFGYAIAEAVAAGKPIIISQGVGLASALQEFACGWILPGATESEAAAAIRRFLATDTAALSAMGAAGRAWAERELSFEMFASRLRVIADATVAGGSIPLSASM